MLTPTSLQRAPRIVRFLCSGGAATALHWATMALLLQTGAHASLSTASGAAVGACANYLLQRDVTFHSTARHRELIPLYLVAVLLGWIANLLVFSVLHDGTHMPIPFAQITTSLLVALLNFWVFKRIVFS